MLDAVLCEFEGVLADTAGLRADALRESLADEGIVTSRTQLADACGGLPPRTAVTAALALCGEERDETGIDVLVLRAERHFAAAAGKGLTLAAGAREFLERAAGRVRLALVTRASRRDVEFVLSLAGLDAAFECVVAAEDTAEPKPSANAYERALERLGRRRLVQLDRAVALEDSTVGLRAARAAGLRCIMVGPLPAHLAAEADALLPSLAGQTPATIGALLSHRTETVG